MSPETVAAQREAMRRILQEMARHRSGEAPTPDFEIVQGDGFLVAKLEVKADRSESRPRGVPDAEYCEV